MDVTNISTLYQEFKERVIAAKATGQSLVIQGGGTKGFYGRYCGGEILDTRSCSGIISYEPTELVITARAGTSLAEIEKTLASHGQMLAFEPPYFGMEATLGGIVACGLSGPRRPYVGSVRDFILGVKCLTGRGEILTFGGQVMKNVAGYDVSRLMTGAHGTLGVLLEISIKVLPVPEYEVSLTRSKDFSSALHDMNTWAGQSLALSAACYDGQHLNIRLSGKRSAVHAAMKQLNMDEHPEGLRYWQDLCEQRLAFFKNNNKVLWRVSVPPATPVLDLPGEWFIDWGGAQRWLKSSESTERIRHVSEQAGGHATLFRGGDRNGEIFHPLSPGIKVLHTRLKQAFDPQLILNRGRMYREF